MIPFAGISTSDYDWLIERASGRDVAEAIYRWKDFRRDGWDVTVLLEDESNEVVAIGCRYKLQEAVA